MRRGDGRRQRGARGGWGGGDRSKLEEIKWERGEERDLRGRETGGEREGGADERFIKRENEDDVEGIWSGPLSFSLTPVTSPQRRQKDCLPERSVIRRLTKALIEMQLGKCWRANKTLKSSPLEGRLKTPFKPSGWRSCVRDCVCCCTFQLKRTQVKWCDGIKLLSLKKEASRCPDVSWNITWPSAEFILNQRFMQHSFTATVTNPNHWCWGGLRVLLKDTSEGHTALA